MEENLHAIKCSSRPHWKCVSRKFKKLDCRRNANASLVYRLNVKNWRFFKFRVIITRYFQVWIYRNQGWFGEKVSVKRRKNNKQDNGHKGREKVIQPYLWVQTIRQMEMVMDRLPSWRSVISTNKKNKSFWRI